MNTPSTFDWQASKSKLAPMFVVDEPIEDMYPQRAYYWRKKAGLTGSRDEPVRGWRCQFMEAADRDRAKGANSLSTGCKAANHSLSVAVSGE